MEIAERLHMLRSKKHNDLMSCSRFDAIAAFFHVVTPQECENVQHPLKKILPLHKNENNVLQVISTSTASISGWTDGEKARTKFRQHMKDKPCKWGFKYWVISDPTVYTCDFNLHCGSAQSKRSENGLAYDVVMSLVPPCVLHLAVTTALTGLTQE